jgi:hypothetical protein
MLRCRCLPRRRPRRSRSLTAVLSSPPFFRHHTLNQSITRSSMSVPADVACDLLAKTQRYSAVVESPQLILQVNAKVRAKKPLPTQQWPKGEHGHLTHREEQDKLSCRLVWAIDGHLLLDGCPKCRLSRPSRPRAHGDCFAPGRLAIGPSSNRKQKLKQ